MLRFGEWITSTFSNGTGGSNCVEVGLQTDGQAIVVRSSKRRAGASVGFTPGEWRAFLAGVKAGEFDIPGDEGMT